MLSMVWLRGSTLFALLALTVLASCQFVTGLADLEVTGSTGGAGSGGGEGSGGSPSECLVGWESNQQCRGVCGDPGDGIHVGCGNFMECYLYYDCLPETCNQGIDDLCGNNNVEGGNDNSAALADEVVECLCGS